MKNTRSLPGKIATTDATQINPGPIVANTPDCPPILENPVFHELPRSRQPESPEEETFRSWLKSNTPAIKASPALLERIKRITHEDDPA